jgi:predicted dehydrogenase
VSPGHGEAKPAATGPQGLVTMKLIDAIYASSQQGRKVKIHA